MYEAKYIVRIDHKKKLDLRSERDKQNDPNLKSRSSLYVKFRFRSEVGRKEREFVRGRMHHINDYLKHKEGITHYSYFAFGHRLYFNDNKEISVSPKSFRLGLNVIVTPRSKGTIIPLEEMLDLDALDHYILTGEMTP